MCDQQRLRPACTYTQSDQSLCLLLEYYRTVKLLTEHQLEFLSLKGGCTGSSESTRVKMPHCWKSLVTDHYFSAFSMKTYVVLLIERDFIFIRAPQHMVNVLKFRTHFSFCSRIKCWCSGLLVRISNREDPDQTASSEAV